MALRELFPIPPYSKFVIRIPTWRTWPTFYVHLVIYNTSSCFHDRAKFRFMSLWYTCNIWEGFWPGYHKAKGNSKRRGDAAEQSVIQELAGYCLLKCPRTPWENRVTLCLCAAPESAPQHRTTRLRHMQTLCLYQTKTVPHLSEKYGCRNENIVF